MFARVSLAPAVAPPLCSITPDCDCSLEFPGRLQLPQPSREFNIADPITTTVSLTWLIDSCQYHSPHTHLLYIAHTL